MTRKGLRALGVASVAAGAITATAFAADPETGTVSAETPKVTWKGTVTGSVAAMFGMAAASDAGDPGQAPCQAPTCDTFTLQVAKQANLSIGADLSGDEQLVGLRIKKPDGSSLFTLENASKGKPLVVQFKNAALGEYVVDYTNGTEGESAYDGFAELAIPKPAPNPPSGGTGGGSPPPSTDPAPGGQPQPQPQPAPAPGTAPAPVQNIDLTIKAGKASARKLKKSRKLTATVTVSREVASLAGTLRKGRTTVAKAKRGTTAGTVKVTLKLSKKAAKKLRRGTLGLTFVAKDAKGTAVTKTVKVKVGK